MTTATPTPGRHTRPALVPPTTPRRLVCPHCGASLTLVKAEAGECLAGHLAGECGALLHLTVDPTGELSFAPVWPCRAGCKLPPRY